ncbi:hypothetical protein FRC08_018908 [Ceratobasidium sp. 394]|nr:hypothetical protein FRC08_018908 [Ceratobasidium sp. 394]
METQEEKIPTITIGGFRFADQQLPPSQIANEKQGTIDNTKDYTRIGNPPGLDFRRPEAYERMATDKLGQELAHDAAIWKLYLEEAEEHDQELVKGRHASLDMLLLFAALFSAILTAFLIESKDLLQQDPADVSAMLLLSIAQSQLRMEQGLPLPPSASSLQSLPEFAPSMSARWINGIWFTSLGLSLSAALISMLGKEWLTAYLSSRPRPAHSHALLRQSRLEGLERWWALHIIALLPSLLHASLLLFAVGLVIYLWTMDVAVAAVMASVVAVTSLFYVVTAVLGAIFEFCPFVTEISGYLRRATVTLLRRNRGDSNPPPKYPTLKDMQALLWLANNARDPAVVDSCYQALAGLQPANDANLDRTATPGSQVYGIPTQLNEETTLTSLLATTIDRFKRLIAGSLDLSGFSEMSAARYIRAIQGISAHISRSLEIPIEESNDKSTVALSDTPNKLDVTLTAQTKHQIFLLHLLSVVDAVWDDSSLRLSANAYAGILISTLGIIQLAISPRFGHKNENHIHVIDITPTEPSRKDPQNQIVNLRAHYSRWLARVSSLLRFASEQKVSINSRLLGDLLGAMATTAHCDALNPPGSSSTHHSLIDIPNLRKYSFAVPSNIGPPLALPPDDLCLGPLGSLIGLLVKYPGVKDGSPTQACLAALEAYSVLAPRLLQEAIGLDGDEMNNAFNIHAWGYAPTTNMMGIRFIAMRQSFLTIRYLGLSRMISSNHFRFLDDVSEIIYFCLSQEDLQLRKDSSYWALANYNDDFIPLLEFVNENDSAFQLLTQNTAFNLLDAVGLPVFGIIPCDNLLTPNCFPPLIRMIGHANNSVSRVEDMLQAMVRRMRDRKGVDRDPDLPWNDIPAIEYIYPFTRSSRGFSALASAGEHDTYIEMAVKTTIDIVHLAAGQDAALTVEPIELHLSAVPSFLDVMSLVATNCRKLTDYDTLVAQYANDALDLLNVAMKDQASTELLNRHPGCRDLLKALEGAENKELTQGVIASFRNALAEWGSSAEIPEQVEPHFDNNESGSGESNQEAPDGGGADSGDNGSGIAGNEDEEA